MSKANPTRPAASSAEVKAALAGLEPRERAQLQKWGYQIDALERVAVIEDQADAVDALLAIMLTRPGYVHDQRDLKLAERVARAVDENAISPTAILVKQGKEDPNPLIYRSDVAVRNPGSTKTMLVTITVIAGILLAVMLIVALFSL